MFIEDDLTLKRLDLVVALACGFRASARSRSANYPELARIAKLGFLKTFIKKQVNLVIDREFRQEIGLTTPYLAHQFFEELPFYFDWFGLHKVAQGTHICCCVQQVFITNFLPLLFVH